MPGADITLSIEIEEKSEETDSPTSHTHIRTIRRRIQSYFSSLVSAQWPTLWLMLINISAMRFDFLAETLTL